MREEVDDEADHDGDEGHKEIEGPHPAADMFATRSDARKRRALSPQQHPLFTFFRRPAGHRIQRKLTFRSAPTAGDKKRLLKASPTSGMPMWQDRLYIALSRQSANATDFFSIPSDRVVELGAQVTICDLAFAIQSLMSLLSHVFSGHPTRAP